MVMFATSVFETVVGGASNIVVDDDSLNNDSLDDDVVEATAASVVVEFGLEAIEVVSPLVVVVVVAETAPIVVD